MGQASTGSGVAVGCDNASPDDRAVSKLALSHERTRSSTFEVAREAGDSSGLQRHPLSVSAIVN